MFTSDTYTNRRKKLVRIMDSSGIVLFLGNGEVPSNYPANPYEFRQDSSFLYFFGIDKPGLAAILDLDDGSEIVFGDDPGIDEIIWTGEQTPLAALAANAGISDMAPSRQFEAMIGDSLKSGRAIHFLPLYRDSSKNLMSNLLRVSPSKVNDQASTPLIQAAVSLRSVKEDQEIDEIIKAIDIADEMHQTAIKMAKPGKTEKEIAGRIIGIATSRGSNLPFHPIVSARGEILHNPHHRLTLKSGNLLVVDAGAESDRHYASDITRTIPVGGELTQRQSEIYEIVLRANLHAISLIKPGARYRAVHLACAKIIAGGLKALGLLKGDIDDIVSQGAHALFFPHGLGHMLGLDAHDMEGLGENYVGYDNEITRSGQFGLAYLRLARKLEERFVLTVEPGIYFIPALISQWKNKAMFSEYINFEKVESYLDFGGIRIEDNIVVTENGCENLSQKIPKTIGEIVALM